MSKTLICHTSQVHMLRLLQFLITLGVGNNSTKGMYSRQNLYIQSDIYCDPKYNYIIEEIAK